MKDRFAERPLCYKTAYAVRSLRCKTIGLLFLVLGLSTCREYQVSDDPSMRLSFSVDTLRFDTVFSEQGSATMQLKVYNRNKQALVIQNVSLAKGAVFKVNIDGEADLSKLHDLTIYGGDSMQVFVRVTDFGKVGGNDAVLTDDILSFHLANGANQDIVLEAYAQNAVRIGHVGCQRTEITTPYTFTADLPYIIFDTLIFGDAVTINAGARLFMHQGACIVALGDLTAIGTPAQPIIIRGDRLDRLFDSVPYAYAGGSWNGIYLQAEKPQTYQLEYVDILSGNVGLSCYSEGTDVLPTLRMDGCRIHNHTLYGLVLNHIDALVTNTEISNCASYCVYCDGGKHDFVHTTVASYFGFTNIRIQSVSKENVAAVYINNLSKKEPTTQTSFYNCIITGYLSDQLVVATPLEKYYPGEFVGNYISQDTAKIFVNNYYKYKEYVYYDFRLDSLSPARGIGDSLVAVPYDTDRNGIKRVGEGIKPDAGCYQYQP